VNAPTTNVTVCYWSQTLSILLDIHSFYILVVVNALLECENCVDKKGSRSL
jgi:hypothetical protein